MPLTHRDGADLFWEEHGDGPPMILAAGLGGVGSYWEPNVAALAERFKLYLIDQRGTGKSSKIPVKSVDQMAADLVAVMDAAGLESAHILGHSTGAAIGVATALDFEDRVRSLMVYASTTHGDPYRHRLFDLRRQIHAGLGIEAYAKYTTLLLYPPYWINANHERMKMIESVAAQQLGDPEVQGSRLDAILAFDRRKEFGRIKAPTMVLCADDDIITPRYFSEDYVKRIPGARARFVERGGHALSRTEPELFNNIALDFFMETSR
jgi:aminoacrylate hydrolase